MVNAINYIHKQYFSHLYQIVLLLKLKAVLYPCTHVKINKYFSSKHDAISKYSLFK